MNYASVNFSNEMTSARVEGVNECVVRLTLTCLSQLRKATITVFYRQVDNTSLFCCEYLFSPLSLVNFVFRATAPNGGGGVYADANMFAAANPDDESAYADPTLFVSLNALHPNPVCVSRTTMF